MRKLCIEKTELALVVALFVMVFYFRLIFIFFSNFDIAKLLTIFLLILIAFFFPSQIHHEIRIIGAILFFSGGFAVQTLLPVLPGPDAQVYFNNLVSHSIMELSEMVTPILSINVFTSSALTFPAFLQVFISDTDSVKPSIIILVNSLLWLLATFLWIKMLSENTRHPIYQNRFFLDILFLLMIASPSPIYWSAVFAKDVMATALTIIAAWALLGRRCILGIVLIVLASMLRPYAIAMISCFYLFVWGRKLFLLIILIGSITVVALFTCFSTGAIGNIPLVVAYLFASPILTDPNNWKLLNDAGTWVFSPVLFTIEGVFYMVLFLSGFVLMTINYSYLRREYFILFSTLIVIASILVLVGFMNLNIQGVDYGLFTIGENLIRKKFAAWPLIVTWGALALTVMWQRIKIWIAHCKTTEDRSKT